MAVKSKHSRAPEQNFKINVVQKDGDILVDQKPVLSSDSRILLVASGCDVKVFSTGGEVIQELVGHKEKTLCFALKVSPGEMRCSKVNSFFVQANLHISIKKGAKKIELKIPEDIKNSRLISSHVGPISKSLYITVKAGSAKTGNLVMFSPKKDNKYVAKIISKGVELGTNKVTVSFNEKFVAMLQLGFLTIKALVGNVKVRHKYENNLLCVVSHPCEEVIATGDSLGQIILWYNALQETPTKKVLHWHTLPIADLAFSASGGELYSGGGECVLVKWQLTEDRRYFLPRLGSRINLITTDTTNQYLVLSMADNALHLVSAKEFKLEGVIQGLAVTSGNKEPFAAGLVYDSNTQAVITNGKIGHLQFYDVHTSKQLYNLDITLTNYITPERHEELINTDVEKVAVTANGKWMATVEYRNDFKTSLELRLKFWNFVTKDQSWNLNTCIELPHDKYVNGLSFQKPRKNTDEPLCVTCSEDGKFKLWAPVDNSDINGSRVCWNCVGVGFYQQHPASAATFVPDGSMVAVAFGSHLTFWLPHSCEFKGDLSQPFLKETIRQIIFGGGSFSNSMVVTRSKSWVCVWDLFTCSLQWRVSLQSTFLASDPLSPYMAVFTKNSEVYIFEGSKSQALCSQKLGSGGPAICAAFVPHKKPPAVSAHWNASSALVFIDNRKKLLTVQAEVSHSAVEREIEGYVHDLLQETSSITVPTPFSALLADTRHSHSSKSNVAQQKGSAGYGLSVEDSHIMVKKALDEARVYRLESIASLTTEFCKSIIPLATTSLEKNQQEEVKASYKNISSSITTIQSIKDDEQRQKKLKKKQLKKRLEKVSNNDFTELMKVMNISTK
ncbi:unnamed protein product, partial [Meganyctiphanes norvegica]